MKHISPSCNLDIAKHRAANWSGFCLFSRQLLTQTTGIVPLDCVAMARHFKQFQQIFYLCNRIKSLAQFVGIGWKGLNCLPHHPAAKKSRFSSQIGLQPNKYLHNQLSK